jgi:hypothetical protein
LSSLDSLPYRPPGALARLKDLGATGQATVPGIYAWAITVAPPAFARGAPRLSRGAAVLGVLLLALAPLLERRRPAAARVVSIWGLVATSLLVWVLAPAASSAPARPDPVRSIAGMLGWALFTLASTAPALPRQGRTVVAARALQPRGDSGHIDAAILLVGIALAAVLQSVGWHTDEPERAVLTRLVALASSVVILGASASVVVLRHTSHPTLPPVQRAKRAVLPLVLFGLWAAGGAIYALALRR